MKKQEFYFYLAGLVDGEGCFTTSVYQYESGHRSIRHKIMFKVSIANKNLEVLKFVKNKLGFGNVSRNHRISEDYIWITTDRKKIKKLINMIGDILIIKRKDVLAFKKMFEITDRKDHLTQKGFIKLLEIRDSIFKGHKKDYRFAKYYKNKVLFPPKRREIIHKKIISFMSKEGETTIPNLAKCLGIGWISSRWYLNCLVKDKFIEKVPYRKYPLRWLYKIKI